ncbi:uncharacterized protein LY89DRAFT_170105 [Mollisia scopiformis]|uniref:Uncharacterized protein n=1 Tax=Mollisia scopiformis TaxID=149040 RepID=A0A194XSQ7_MOLSC|nr:uncharacterized protein LY89DRAFT_170105 [Mollisia scopiformis]KUJ23176.1 hypothetical protein LY89DRAFT_170105 [Mollisia scopiformis]
MMLKPLQITPNSHSSHPIRVYLFLIGSASIVPPHRFKSHLLTSNSSRNMSTSSYSIFSPSTSNDSTPVKQEPGNSPSQYTTESDEEEGDEVYEGTQRSAKRTRIERAEETREVVIGHHIDEPSLVVYATFTKAGHVVFKARKSEASLAVRNRWHQLIQSSKHAVHRQNVVFDRVALKGNDPENLTLKEVKELETEYAIAKIRGTAGREVVDGVASNSQRRVTTMGGGTVDSPAALSGGKLLAAVKHHKDTGAALARVAREHDTESSKKIRAMQRVIDDQAKELAKREKVVSPANLSQIDTDTFMIGNKVYNKIPADMPNAGLYMEKGGRVKHGYQEKVVLSEYSSYKTGEVFETVVFKDTEFLKTASGEYVQKQEDLVEIDGKTYVRRRVYVSYDSDEE